jgi:hypothetical protein
MGRRTGLGFRLDRVGRAGGRARARGRGRAVTVMVANGGMKFVGYVRGRARDRARPRGECGVKMIAVVRDARLTTMMMCLLPAQYHQYQVVGRHVPTETQPEPEVFRMKLWALDAVKARSKFWYVG